MSNQPSIAVIGLWHLGTVVSACWADAGCHVVAFDPDPRTMSQLQSGQAPVFEPGLNELIGANVSSGRLRFSSDAADVVRSAPIVFVTFDTPVDENDASTLKPIEDTLHAITPHLQRGSIVVVSSQVPVGTCSRWREEMRQLNGDTTIDVAYSPENLRLGEAIACYRKPDRIVLGVDNDKTRIALTQLFGRLNAPVLSMSLASAEMAKHALNSFLATSVSFINEIASLCEVTGADVLSVVEALKSDPRIGPRAFLSPGFGFAGGTLARDVQVLRNIGKREQIDAPLLSSVLTVNHARPAVLLNRLRRMHSDIRGITVGVLGLTYKAGTSTLRRSAALSIIRMLMDAGVQVRAYDPKADLGELDGAADFEVVSSAYEAAKGASALAILTEWPEFATLDFDRIRSAMAKPVIFDGKNLLANLNLGERGFVYQGIGR